MMSIQKHNANKFLIAHNQQVQYEQLVGFKSEKTRIELNKETPKEYFLHEEYLGYTDCCLVCSMRKASLPQSKQRLAEAAKVLNMHQPVWINTTQTTTIRESWKWKTGMYDYETKWGNTTIFPNSKSQDHDVLCRAYKKGEPIAP